MRLIDEIIIHCSATTPSMDIGADWIRKIHVDQNGWSDIGYHFIVLRDGAIELGRDVARMGAHCKGKNRNTIGICMVGGIDEHNRPEDNFTPEQFVATQSLINKLKVDYPAIKELSGHNQYSTKACPSFNVSLRLIL